MRPRSLQRRLPANPALRRRINFCTAVLLLALFPGVLTAQAAKAVAPIPVAQSQAAPAIPAQPSASAGPAPQAATSKPVRDADRRRAAKLYLAASKLFVKEAFEEAMHGYERAAQLDPNNTDYPLAVTVSRSHAVTALIQAAAKARARGDAPAARAALAHALELEPANATVGQHLNELGDDALRGQTRSLYEHGLETAGESVELTPAAGVHSFNLHADQRQVIQQVFKAYGIETTVDESVRPLQVRLNVDNASFGAATRILGMVTKSFYVPLDAHRALVANDTKENRQQFLRQELETIYLAGLTATELTEVGTLAKNVFDVQQATLDPSAATITIRAPERTLNAFNATLSELLVGQSQVLLDVRIIQLAHTHARDTGVQPPQSISAINVYTEEQSLLNANASAVQQVISSGLASANDPLAILLILAAAGEITSPLLSNGFALFGGGLTQSALSVGGATLNFSLNSSDSRQLDQIQLRLGDGEAGTVRSGTRYPIQTSSYSSLSASSSAIAGLTGAGNSSSISSLLASYASSASATPMVEYQDLGLTLKATPKVMRDNDVALTIDMKIDSLSGTSLNGNPKLDNRAFSGVVTLKQGEAAVMVTDLAKSESRSISGVPGISDVPGLNNMTGKDTQKNYATLLIVMTPHLIRGTQAAGHSPILRIERGQAAH